MIFPIKIKELCTPASVYLYISAVGLVASIIQNMMSFNNNTYKCGAYAMIVPSVLLIFLFKVIYITFWTYILNLLCKDNNRTLAWLLVIFPFLLLFVILGLLILTSGNITASNSNLMVIA
jgi:hypothetical protein